MGPLLSYYDHESREDIVKRLGDWLTTSKALVAECNGIALGYIIADGTQIQFIYVKQPYRRIGIAKKLIELTTGNYKPIQAKRLPKLDKLSKQFRQAPNKNLWIKE